MNGAEFHQKVNEEVSKVIVGKEKVVTLLLTSLLAGGHVLLEDVPGTGKTKLARTLAKTLQTEFARIQFTPDLLPSDLTGLKIFDREKNAFVLRKGPVFTNLLLADEINRATPRTQSGLLEAMAEKSCTIDGDSMALPDPFFVIATQNPIENAGTFPLPEAQLDRFLMKLSVGLPEEAEELDILQKYHGKDPFEETQAVVNEEELQTAIREASQVKVSQPVQEYIVKLVRATREAPGVMAGVSTRGMLAMQSAVQAYAYLQGRDYVIPDDVKDLAPAVFTHRILAGASYGSQGKAEGILKQILQEIPAPTENFAI